MGGLSSGARLVTKSGLATLAGRRPASGATLLIYHRIGGGTSNELDISQQAFVGQLDRLSGHDVISLDAALDRLDAGNASPSFVLTFDDGFEEVYRNAWPLLRARGLPFTVYLASAYVKAPLVWEGATATGPAGRGLSWPQLSEMLASGLCTIGNHTHRHVRPEELSEADLDACSDTVERHLGVRPRHFTYPWGVRVPAMEPALRARFRSASTAELGRNLPGVDPMRLRRVPVRRTDPDAFFAAKLVGNLWPERVYGGLVRVAKGLGVNG